MERTVMKLSSMSYVYVGDAQSGRSRSASPDGSGSPGSPHTEYTTTATAGGSPAGSPGSPNTEYTTTATMGGSPNTEYTTAATAGGSPMGSVNSGSGRSRSASPERSERSRSGSPRSPGSPGTMVTTAATAGGSPRSRFVLYSYDICTKWTPSAMDSMQWSDLQIIVSFINIVLSHY